MEQLILELWGLAKEQGFTVVVITLVAWRLDQRVTANMKMLENMVEECWQRLLDGDTRP